MRYKHPVRFPFHATQIDTDIRDHQGLLMASFGVLGADLLSEFKHNNQIRREVRYNVAGQDYVAFELDKHEIDPASAYVLSVSVKSTFRPDAISCKYFSPGFRVRNVAEYMQHMESYIYEGRLH